VRVALISNRASGEGGAGGIAGRLRALAADVEELEVGEAERAAGLGAERIVVAGGDGSIAPAAAAAAQAERPLAVVPAGTANDFAARMGLPAEIGPACELALRGTRTRALDLAHGGAHPFVNVASIGLAPHAAEAAVGLKSRLGPLAYAVGALRAGLRADPVDCRVRCDGETTHDGAAWQVTVACSGAFGAGAEIEADADDGRLDVVAIEAGPRLRLVTHAYGLRAHRIERQRAVGSCRCAEAELRADPGGELNVDGELVPFGELGEGGTIRFTVAPRAFRLVIG
jgi:diacylglycerol kinase (ATP)